MHTSVCKCSKPDVGVEEMRGACHKQDHSNLQVFNKSLHEPNKVVCSAYVPRDSLCKTRYHFTFKPSDAMAFKGAQPNAMHNNRSMGIALLLNLEVTEAHLVALRPVRSGWPSVRQSPGPHSPPSNLHVHGHTYTCTYVTHAVTPSTPHTTGIVNGTLKGAITSAHKHCVNMYVDTLAQMRAHTTAKEGNQ